MPKTNIELSDDYLARLQDAIRRTNGCDSKYLETVTVSESFQGFQKETVWHGEVAEFEVYGHPKANRAYAWSLVSTHGMTRYVVVLNIPPVTSAQTAVQAALAAQILEGTRS